MGMPKLWVKGLGGAQGFVFSHVKTIYYNWASKILLSTKLDEMDALIDAKIAKAMMSNQQVNDADRVPTSALAYAMAQGIAANANNISRVNGRFLLFEGATAINSPKNGDDISYRVQVENNGTFKMYEISPAGAVSGKTIFSYNTPSDTLLYQSGEVVCDPGITEITIEHSDVSTYSQAMRFFSVIRPNEIATEQITVSMAYGNTATSTKFTVRNSGNNSRAVKINLCIFCK